MPYHPKKPYHLCRKSVAPDPLVDPGNPPHRHQARPPARSARPHHRMVVVAACPPGPSSSCPSQAGIPHRKNATVMLVSASLPGFSPYHSSVTSGLDASLRQPAQGFDLGHRQRQRTQVAILLIGLVQQLPRSRKGHFSPFFNLGGFTKLRNDQDHEEHNRDNHYRSLPITSAGKEI